MKGEAVSTPCQSMWRGGMAQVAEAMEEEWRSEADKDEIKRIEDELRAACG